MTEHETHTELADADLVERADRGLSGQGSVVEMMRRLKDAVSRLERTTSAQQRKVLWLTCVMVILTLAAVFLAGVEFFRLFRAG